MFILIQLRMTLKRLRKLSCEASLKTKSLWPDNCHLCSRLLPGIALRGVRAARSLYEDNFSVTGRPSLKEIFFDSYVRYVKVI